MTTTNVFGKSSADAAEPVDNTRAYDVNESFLIVMPAAGDFVDVNGQAIENSTEAYFTLPGGGIPAIVDTANPTPAEIAVLNVVDGPKPEGEYVLATDGQNLAWGGYYVLDPLHTYNFPAVTESYGSNQINALPSNKDWQTGFDPVNNWVANGTDTIGASQASTVEAISDVIMFFGELGAPSNILVSG